ncbi:hypothetical protein GCM10028857_20990 [Salinarchaeum chitinilyticum]
METRRLRAGVVLLLAVAALGAAGAAVDSSGGGGSGSSGTGSGTTSGSGGSQGGGFAPMPDEAEPLFPGDVLAMLIGIVAVGGFVVAVVAAVLAILRWDWDDLLAYVRSRAQTFALFVLGVVAIYALFELLTFSNGGGSTGDFSSGAEGVSDTASATGVELTAAVGIAIVIVLLLLLALIARSAEDEDDGAAASVASEPEESGGGTSGVALGGATVASPPADNEVYRAWLSLANAANANARQETPEEVADRAVDAGVDEAAAREITSLFESVRYGDREPTSGIEQRAERARAKLSGER